MVEELLDASPEAVVAASKCDVLGRVEDATGLKVETPSLLEDDVV